MSLCFCFFLMVRRTPIATRTYTPFPDATLCRSGRREGRRAAGGAGAGRAGDRPAVDHPRRGRPDQGDDPIGRPGGSDGGDGNAARPPVARPARRADALGGGTRRRTGVGFVVLL